MQIPSLPMFHFDLFGNLRDNRIDGEIFTRLVDNKANIIIPQFGPFYVDSLVVKHSNGLPMIIDVDYEIVTIDPKLTMYTCKPVSSMIRLLDTSIGEGFLYYQAVGAGTAIDESIVGMVDYLLADPRPISFYNLNNRPSYYPPDVHQKSLRYDFFNFKSLIDLVTESTDILDRFHKSGLKAKEARAAVLAEHAQGMNLQLNVMLDNHKEGYNPHNLNSATFNLGNVDNVPTANKRQALQGLSDLRLTPQGLNEIVKAYRSRANGLMPANILPIFHYGRDGFLPPSIDGAYLGNGFQYGCGGACLEPNGDLTILRNRYNGRVRGLYYETMDNFVGGERNIRFTSALYDSPAFKTDKAIIDSIVDGSNNKVLMVFDSTNLKASYLINPVGSFDPRSQEIYRTDMSAVTGYNPRAGSIHDVGSFWVYIQFGNDLNVEGEGSVSGMKLYSCLKVSARAGTATFAPLIVDSQDLQGNAAKSATFTFGKLTKGSDVNNPITEYILKFPNPMSSIETSKAIAVQSAKKPRSGNVAVFHFHYGFTPNYYLNGETYAAPTIELQVIMELDIDNLTFKPTSDNPPKGELIYDHTNPMDTRYYYGKTQAYGNYDPHPMIDDFGTTTSIVDRFRVMIFNSQGIGQDAIIYNFSPSLSTYDIVSKPWGKNGNIYLKTDLNYPVNSAFEVASNCGFTAISDRFDIFYGLDALSYRELPFVKVYNEGDSGFAVRPGIETLNKSVTSLYSRPLSNNVSKWLDKPNMPLVNISAEESLLNIAGLSVGELGISAASSKQNLNYPPTNLEMVKMGLTLPLLNKFDVSSAGVEVRQPDHIDIDQWMIDDLIFTLTGSQKVSLYDYTFDIFSCNGMNMNAVTELPTVIVLSYILGNDRKSVYTVTALVNIKLASNGVSVGGIELLGRTTSTLALHDPVEVKVSLQPAQSLIPTCMVGYLTKVNNEFFFEFKTNSTTYYKTSNGIFSIISSGKFNLTGMKFVTSSLTPNDVTNQTIFGVIPKVGIKDTVIPYRDQAGGAAVYLGTGAQTYLMSSTYVDKQFSLFFIGDQQVTLSGGRYLLKSGCIDLRDIDPSPENKAFFVYAKLTNGVATYHVTLTELVQTPYCGMIARVVTNGAGIVNIERYHKFMIDGVDLKR